MVTYSTALKLREVGFPQPRPENGQHWYFDNIFNEKHPFPAGSTEFALSWDDYDIDKGVFAPTAIDILKEIPWTSMMYDALNQHWRAVENYCGEAFYHQSNPAEAAAEAYFFEQHRKADKNKSEIE